MTKTPLKPRRVLIADDNEQVRSLLVELLEQEGYEVLSASDGRTALDLALSNDLDVVVSDVVMPVLDGIELCRRLKRHVDTSRVPVLLISGVRRSSEDGLEGLTAGADDYLDVPFRNEAFLVKVARLAERHQIEKHYREIVEQAADIIYTRTIDGHITSINAAGCEFFGRSAAELVGVHLSDLIGEEAGLHDTEETRNHPSDKPVRSRHWLTNAQGQLRYLDGMITVEANNRGEPTAVRGVVRDLTEQKLADEALQESEERYRRLVECSPDAIVVTGEGKFVYVNSAAEALYRATSDQLIGKSLLEVVHPDYRDSVLERIKTIHEEGSASALSVQKHIRLDGEVIDVEVTGMPLTLQGKPAVQAVIRDVTDRTRAREALKETETRLQTVIGSASLVLFAIDSDGIFTLSEGEGLKALGLKAGEVVGQSVFEIYREVPQIIANIRRAMSGDAFSEAVEVGELAFNTRYSPQHDQHGKVIGVIGVATDITETRKSEKVSRENEERYRELVENANDIIYTHDLAGNFTSLNRSGERIVGYTWEEAAKMNIGDVIAPEYISLARQMITQKANTKAPTVYEIDLVAKDGRRIRIEVSSRIIYENGQPVGVQGVARDLTEHQRSQEALRESQTFFHSFMDNSPSIAFMKDEEGRYVYVNKPFEQLFGHKLEFLRGKTSFDWLPAVTAQNTHDHDLSVLTSGEHVRLLRVMERVLGKAKRTEADPIPINVDGAISAICGDIGLDHEFGAALFIISRVPGLIAHAHEERLRERPMRQIDPKDAVYDGPGERRLPEGRK